MNKEFSLINGKNILRVNGQEINLTSETIDLITSKLFEMKIEKLSELINNGIISNLKKSDSCSQPRIKTGISESVCIKIKNAWLACIQDIYLGKISLKQNKLVLGEIRKRCNVNLKTLKLFFDEENTYYQEKYNVTLDVQRFFNEGKIKN